ncbi:hypothetical protein BTR23_18820 [Alkalihalophilus pseudofirmus]|nr:hypothetical protein BTR23_18820 [Alkalihalophilus pseudofirmus]
MSKKLVYLISICCLLLLVTACNNNQETTTEDNETQNSSADANANWPDENITLIVPYSVGGSADRQARALAPFLEDELGVSIIIENREGGSGAVGTMTHFQSDPADGTHLIYQSHPHFESGVVRGAGFDFEDFAYLGITHSSPITYWVSQDSPFETLEDLLTEIESNPNSLSYGMLPASWSDISIKMVLDALGLEARAVPFDGGGPLRTALLGNQVDFIATDVEGTLAGAGDDLRPLAIFNEEPYEHAPEIPLINEELANMGHDVSFPAISNMRFIQVKQEFKEQYPDRWEILSEAFQNAVENPEFIEWGTAQSMYLNWTNEEETNKFLSESIEVIRSYEDLFQ